VNKLLIIGVVVSVTIMATVVIMIKILMWAIEIIFDRKCTVWMKPQGEFFLSRISPAAIAVAITIAPEAAFMTS
jgi:hypothetical protein